RGIAGEDGAADADDRPGVDIDAIDPMPECDADEALIDALSDAPDERLEHSRPGTPGDMEARHRVAVAGGPVAAALGPPHDREEADATLPQPCPLLFGGELEVRLCPPARPPIFVAVETRRAEPVLPGEFERVADPHAPLLGRVDEEDPAERPPGLRAEVGR